MSQENVDLASAQTDAWNEGDFDAFLEFFHPDVVVEVDPSWPDGGVYRGRDAWREFVLDFERAWERTTQWETDEAVDLGDRVLVRYRVSVRGRASGVEMEHAFSYVDTFRDGRVVHRRYYLDHAEARSAVGLDV